MILKRKILLLIGIFLTLLVLGSTNVLGEISATDQPDELWAKAVLLASQNQGLFPENIHEKSKLFNSKGEEKYTEESWEKIVETENGSLETELVKKLENGKDVNALGESKKRSKKIQEYNIDLSDLTHPFSPITQPSITVQRLNQIESKAGRDCVVYDFKCATSKGDSVVGKAWLSETGIPVAISYSYDPLPKWLPKQLKYAVHEVHYQYHSNEKWYPEKVFIELKSRHLCFNRLTYFEYTFSDFRKQKVLELITKGKPLIEGHKAHIVPFDYIDNHIFVKVKINNMEKDYRFLLDTGAGTTVINPRSAAVLNFKKAAEMNVTDGFISKKVDLVMVQKITLGEVVVENCGASVFDMEKIEATHNIEIDGILGSNFLRFFTIQIDYLKKELVIATNYDCFSKEIKQSHRIPLGQSPTGLVFAPLKIPGVEAPFITEIDTGAGSGLSIPLNYIGKFKPALNSKEVKLLGTLSGGAFGESKGMLSRLGEFEMGDLLIENLVVRFENRKLDFLILGNDFLSRFTVIINYPKNEMFLLPLKDKILETNIMSFGFNTKQNENGHLQITGLYEGSVAEQAGLRVGDIIVRVDAEGESGTTNKEFMRISEKYDTIHLFVQRDAGEKEIVIKKDWLLLEVK